jgi:hypothetical protein
VTVALGLLGPAGRQLGQLGIQAPASGVEPCSIRLAAFWIAPPGLRGGKHGADEVVEVLALAGSQQLRCARARIGSGRAAACSAESAPVCSRCRQPYTAADRDDAGAE